MRLLKKLGFIDARPGPHGPFSYVLIFNPYLVIKQKQEESRGIEETSYNALLARCSEIGATDMLDNKKDEDDEEDDE